MTTNQVTIRVMISFFVSSGNNIALKCLRWIRFKMIRLVISLNRDDLPMCGKIYLFLSHKLKELLKELHHQIYS